MRIIIADTETTGIEDSEVIELAFIDLDEKLQLSPAPIFHQFYTPAKPITLGALAAHHILPSKLVGYPASINAKLPDNTAYIIGHNIDFDWKVLGSPNVRRICTLALARRAWPDLDSYTQSALMYHIHGATEQTRDRLSEAHSAAADILFCHDILKAVCTILDIHNIEQLYAASEDARIPTKMPFGKHKGEPIADVPRNYVLWYRRQENPDPFLLEAFKRAGK